MKNKGVVTADHEHFKKAKLEYRNWMQAIFREAIQNSTDAGANSIFINYYFEDNELILEFQDNGNGMSLDTLLNVLLKMGGSKKKSGQNIGGFGYAKSILFFAHEKYFIKTRNFEVNGIGGEYTYEEVNNNQEGTYFKINIENDYYHVNIEKIDAYLKELIEYSNLKNINFTINGVKNNIKHKCFNYNLDSSLGKLTFNDSGFGSSSVLWIRVNGLAMFKHSTYQNDNSSVFEGVIDINKSPLEMLTANRDGLQYTYSSELNLIFQKLSKEREKLKYEGMFNFILNKESIEEEATIKEEDKKDFEISLFISNIETTTTESEKDRVVEKVFKDLSGEKDKFENFFEIALNKINQKYYPNNFSISTEKKENNNLNLYKNFFQELLKQKNIRISIMWDVIIDEILKISYFSEYIRQKDNFLLFNENKIYKGFVFGEDSLLGSNTYSSEEGYYISINPINKHITNDFECIFDIAIHECTHFIINNHDSGFCFSEFLLRRSIQKEIKKSDLKLKIKNRFKNLQNNIKKLNK